VPRPNLVFIIVCRNYIKFETRWLQHSVTVTSTAGPRYIRGCCLMLERQYGFRAGAWVGKALF